MGEMNRVKDNVFIFIQKRELSVILRFSEFIKKKYLKIQYAHLFFSRIIKMMKSEMKKEN